MPENTGEVKRKSSPSLERSASRTACHVRERSLQRDLGLHLCTSSWATKPMPGTDDVHASHPVRAGMVVDSVQSKRPNLRTRIHCRVPRLEACVSYHQTPTYLLQTPLRPAGTQPRFAAMAREGRARESRSSSECMWSATCRVVSMMAAHDVATIQSSKPPTARPRPTLGTTRAIWNTPR